MIEAKYRLKDLIIDLNKTDFLKHQKIHIKTYLLNLVS